MENIGSRWPSEAVGEGNGNPLQYSCLERSLVGYSPWGHKESDTAVRLHSLEHVGFVIEKTEIQEGMRLVPGCRGNRKGENRTCLS